MNFKQIAKTLPLVLAITFSPLIFAKTVWIDVRTFIEHSFDNIEGDVRISHSDIVEEVNLLFPDKKTEIKLYCRSGTRAGIAMEALKSEGYINVSNAGSIEKVRKKRQLDD